LTLLYDIDVSRTLLQPWSTIPSILLIILIIGFAFYISKKRPLLSFCIIFYFLNHIIEGSIFNLELIYEHRNYLPSMLLFVPVAEFIIYVIDYFSYKKVVQLIVASSIIIILTGFGDITYRRNTVFSSEFLLWMDNIEKYPNLSRSYANLGNAYMHYQQKAKGLHNYEKAMALNNFANTHVRASQEHNMGLYYFLEGKYDLALPYFERTYKIIQLYLQNTIFIAKIHLLRNEFSRAHRLIEPFIKKYPNNPELNEIFCLILFKENNFKEAELYANKSLMNNLSSTFPLPFLAETARKRGNIRSAVSLWKLYQQSDPLNPYANLALIELYAQMNNKELLNEELSKLFCFKKTRSLSFYLKEISRKKNLLVYIPNTVKIQAIVVMTKL
jgi:tetratricopeptide (TPR) repeat protein